MAGVYRDTLLNDVIPFWLCHGLDLQHEGIIATLLAYELTHENRYAEMYRPVQDWSFAHFPDCEHGEWSGYLHRDGSLSQRAKGNMYKGPFHLPRMLWFCAEELGAWNSAGVHGFKAS